MNTWQKIILLVFVNALGFLSPSFCYYIGVVTGKIALGNPDFDPVAFRMQFFPAIMMTWLVCACFSVSFLFLKNQGRWFFLLAPLVIPVLYGLSAL